jgi:FkbM family methyltransferase
LNAALKRQPREFESTTRFGFRVTGTTLDLIQRYLYIFGVWEPDATAAVLPYLREGSTVIDVGANVGYFSLLASVAVGASGSVHAVEALPSTVELLTRNIELNQASNVTVHSVAASDHDGEVEVFRAADRFLGSSSTRKGEHAEGRVRCLRLDDLFARVDGGDVSVLKIDVEGDEAAVLRGAARLLETMRARTAALVELSPDELAGQRDNRRTVLDLMSSHGFAAFGVPNEYSSSRYADVRISAPRPLGQGVTGWTDALFVKQP